MKTSEGNYCPRCGEKLARDVKQRGFKRHIRYGRGCCPKNSYGKSQKD